ncbi:MAG: peroxide stress protein YaaA [Actinomycetia bacterium]|nr:peroxide stress protein YaaA [Actinomycetes bacterium]MCP5031667.1 peroxide stress protein YaaA [Actinomycetes bacterium]
MLIVVSPARSLDYESPLATGKYSEPALLERSAELVDIMATKSPAELSKMLGVSQALAETSFERFQDWELPFTPDNARPALLAFSGDVYVGMDASGTFSERDYSHAQKTLRILSALHGVLRPLDLMQPYRLEMGTKLKTSAGRDLYDFWGSEITEVLQEAIDDSPGPKLLINLASNEYFNAVRLDELTVPVITPTFLDRKGGTGDYRLVAFFAKRARGAMAGWIIRNRVKSIRGLQSFEGLGYLRAPERSTPHQPVFIRDNT